MWREPRKGDDREVHRRQEENIGAASGIARLFGQVMLLPLVTLVYAVESFARALWEIRDTSDRTLDAFTRSEAQPFDQLNAPARTVSLGDSGDSRNNSSGTDYAALNVSAGAVNRNNQTTEQPTETEAYEMTEQDLRGDDLKLVRWYISFTKRDLEEALDQGVELIDYGTTLGDYQGAKKLEYVGKILKSGAGFERPQTWVTEKYPEAKYIETRPDGEYVIGLPSEDRDKYLRVFVEVVTRYEKEERPYKKVKVVNYP
jgi:hypothetical protein